MQKISLLKWDSFSFLWILVFLQSLFFISISLVFNLFHNSFISMLSLSKFSIYSTISSFISSFNLFPILFFISLSLNPSIYSTILFFISFSLFNLDIPKIKPSLSSLFSIYSRYLFLFSLSLSILFHNSFFIFSFFQIYFTIKFFFSFSLFNLFPGLQKKISLFFNLFHNSLSPFLFFFQFGILNFFSHYIFPFNFIPLLFNYLSLFQF
ncbi:unnamed protein product [Acanthosepion pharaonis]|uniref:Uncharacterized protein n=1 Tax=Acanthosepion pharaonis TaxID=158019 RepID=A0A812C6L5_ACAPH|nr:unnamed protein product [Sepia pharaonis]